MADVALRPYRPDDAPALSAIYRAAVETLGPDRYAPAQVAAWASLTPSAAALDDMMTDGRARTVAEADGEPVGFVDLCPDGHGALIYVRPDMARRGIGAQLVDALRGHARAFGLHRIHTEASELARPVFARAGFLIERRREVTIDGVTVHNYAMTARVGPA